VTAAIAHHGEGVGVGVKKNAEGTKDELLGNSMTDWIKNNV
jgi:hypothetical protein